MLLIEYKKEIFRSEQNPQFESLYCIAHLEQDISKSKPVSRPLDLVCWQGTVRFESGAYTLVREHFESDCNTAIGQEMMELIPVLFLLLIFQRYRYRAV